MREGWTRVCLGDVSSTAGVVVVPFAGDARPYVALENIAQGQPTLLGHGRADSALSAKTEFRRGDILYGKLRPNLRKAVQAPFDGVCSTDVVAIRTHPGVEPGFVMNLLHTDRFTRYAVETASGTKMPRTNWAAISAFEFLLPPLDEQRRIAAVLSAIDVAFAAAAAVSVSLMTLRQRLADTLFDGLAAQVALTPLGECATIQTGVAKNKASVGAAHERPYLSVANVKDGYLDLSTLKTIHVEQGAIVRFALRNGDVLFCEGGDADKVGRGTVWRDEIPGCLHQNHVFAVRTDPERLLPDFLSFYRSTTAGRRYFLDAAKQTTNLASINSSQLRAMPIPIPSLGEQRRVVALIGGIEARLMAERRAEDETERVKRAVATALLDGAT